MDKEKLVSKVLGQLKLPPQVRGHIPSLTRQIKAMPPSGIVSLLKEFQETNRLSDAQFGEVMNQLIDSHVFLTSDKTRDLEKIKELKKITDTSPIKQYFDRTY